MIAMELTAAIEVVGERLLLMETVPWTDLALWLKDAGVSVKDCFVLKSRLVNPAPATAPVVPAVPIRPVAAAPVTAAVAAAAPLTVGGAVVLSSAHASFDDAADGPLKPGDVGLIVIGMSPPFACFEASAHSGTRLFEQGGVEFTQYFWASFVDLTTA